jgi:hypothetical protein
MCAQLPGGCVWELEARPVADGGAWRGLGPRRDTRDVAATNLTPGTRYVFRARAGAGLFWRPFPIVLCTLSCLLCMWLLMPDACLRASKHGPFPLSAHFPLLRSRPVMSPTMALEQDA